jgi:hypothetical protein
MPQTDDSFVKILFRFYSNVLDQWTVETMWAVVVDKDKGLYKIDNIPFYAAIASGDIVFAAYDDSEEMLTYRETVEYSGNSTIQVVIMDKAVMTDTVRQAFTDLGCFSEKYTDGYFVLEIPGNADYQPIGERLLDYLEKGTIDFAEPWLSDKHIY